MSNYLNPGNGMFQDQLDRIIYVDKTGLIKYTNDCIIHKEKYLCVSRPRRFGKSYAADMLKAYYGRGCDSHALFDGLAIAKDDSYEKHINKYNVLYFDVAQHIKTTVDAAKGIAGLTAGIVKELKKGYPDIEINDRDELPSMFDEIFTETGTGFVFILDEWDCPFRERKEDKKSQELYLQFLKDLFRNHDYVSLVYMTGILPIKRYGTHSALNMFNEISMTSADPLQEYMGFTETEVRRLCAERGKDYEEIKAWYNGYNVDGVAIYNPYAVVKAVISNLPPEGYWTNSETYEALDGYIKANIYGLQDVLSSLLEGKSVKVDTKGFANDMVTFKSRDDILTLLIHLGYLSYDKRMGEARIPNHEIKEQFEYSVKEIGLENFDCIKLHSRAILDATLKGDSETVAKMVKRMHRTRSSALEYNRELSLKCAIEFSYLAAEEHYNVFLELPAGDGFADVGYIPMNTKNPACPPMVIELKVNKTAKSALKQALDSEYYDALSGYHGDVILVGINYDEKTKDHTCVIERVQV